MSKLSNKAISTFKRLVVILGIIIIPLLYSYLYLGAFWDPYSRLDTLPIAIVNADEGAAIHNKNRNLGNELVDSLKEDGSLKFVVTTEDDAKAGTEDSKYYATLWIPSNFSQNIASAETANRTTATLSFSANEKRNYLASQIMKNAVLQMENKLCTQVDSEIVQSLSDQLTGVPDSLTTLSDGLGKLSDGAATLATGSKTLSDGTATLATNMAPFKAGVKNAVSGSTSLATGAASLDTGIDNLLAGVKKLSSSTEDIDKVTKGAASLAEGAKTFNASLTTYITGVDSLISSVNSTSAFLKNYATTINPSIMKDPYFAAFMTQMADPAAATNLAALSAANANLKAASAQISAGAQTLASGTAGLPEIKSALAQIEGGLVKAQDGSAALSSGAGKLESGLNEINTATDKISTAADDISSGASSVAEGAATLADGVNTAKTGVDDSITTANADLNSLNGLSDYASNPVTITNNPVNPVANYGTAFAPYFLSLSLWVGALMIFLGTYLDSDGKFAILSKNSNRKVLRSFIYLGLGLVQALVLGVMIEVFLGLQVKDNLGYFLACGLYSLVAVSIIQFFMVNFKDLGKFISIIILILQLTACGGTFPMETVPKFFNVIYPFMPMTYSVGLLKEAISGGDINLIIRNTTVLAAIAVVFTAMTIFMTVRNRKRDLRLSKKNALRTSGI